MEIITFDAETRVTKACAKRLAELAKSCEKAGVSVCEAAALAAVNILRASIVKSCAAPTTP